MILSWTPARMFTGRYAVVSGKRVHPPRWKRQAFEGINASQKENQSTWCVMESGSCGGSTIASTGTTTVWPPTTSRRLYSSASDGYSRSSRLPTASCVLKRRDGRRASRSRPSCGERSSSATVGAASSAARTSISSTTTFFRWHMEGQRPSRTFSFSAPTATVGRATTFNAPVRVGHRARALGRRSVSPVRAQPGSSSSIL